MTKEQFEKWMYDRGYSIQPDGTWGKGGAKRVGSDGSEAGDKGLRSAKPKPVKRPALVKDVSGETKSLYRIKILFRIYSVRPLDWDNYSIKQLQDLLVKSGILPDDKWSVLSGEVVSEKVDRKEEERTQITFTVQ